MERGCLLFGVGVSCDTKAQNLNDVIPGIHIITSKSELSVIAVLRLKQETNPMMMSTPLVAALVLVLRWRPVVSVSAFVPAAINMRRRPVSSRHFMADTEKKLPSIADMRVAEIRNELKEMKIDFSDCFDKESLVLRLQDARAGKVTLSPDTTTPTATSEQATAPAPAPEPTTTTTSPVETPKELPKEVKEQDRAMSVRELRQELAQRQIRWAGLLEKQDLIQAVLDSRQQALTFSVTGKLTPGQVADLTGAEIEQEFTGGATPILLDVYAVWCGPCKLVAPEVQKVAEALGDRLRVAKMDSDQHVDVSSKLRVQGLPSLILFQNGKEVDRIEGALMKDQIIQWVGSKVSL